jgi:hypothetical protein
MYEKYKPTHVIHLAALGMFSVITPRDYPDLLIASRRVIQEHEVQGV